MSADGIVKFGNYFLMNKIAVGGMAEIWRAKTVGVEGFERIVALKCIIPSYTQSQEFRTMFIDEARIASSLNHSNVVRITNFGEINGSYYHEMEYVDGRNLRQIIQKCREQHTELPMDSACFIISEVLKGLDFAHRKHDQSTNVHLNIIHRDMSPQNIMLSFEGEIKIIDWGIAKAKGKMEETRAGVLKGKFGYMSPEQAGGEDLDHRTDIFSTGIILYEVCTGERLFAADNEINILKKIQEGVIPPPTKINPNIKAELEAIILKALKKNRNERYGSALEMHEDLSGFLNKFYPSFTTSRLSRFIKELFSAEIVEERKMYKELESSVSSSSWSEMGTADKTKVSKPAETRTDELSNHGRQSSKSPMDAKTIVTQDTRSTHSKTPDQEKTVVDSSAKDDLPPHPNDSTAVTDFDMPMAGDETKKRLKKGRVSTRSVKTSSNRKRMIFISLVMIAFAFLISEYDPFGLFKQEQVRQGTNVQPEQTVVQPAVQPEPIVQPIAPVVQPEPVARPVKTKKEQGVSEPVRQEPTHMPVKEYKQVQPYQVQQVIPQNAGLLTIEVSPSCMIYIDGKLVSKFQPLVGFQLRQGKHRVRFINRNLKIDNTIEVKIKGGQHVHKNVSLR